MKALLADTGYLMALYSRSGRGRRADDPRRVEKARDSYQSLFERAQNVLVLAWPVLYETLKTELSQRDVAERITSEWGRLRRGNQLQFVDDRKFREPSLTDWESEVTRGAHHRPLSLVDRVLRNAILSRSLKIDALLTFNVKDFADICSKMGIQMLPSM
jgi:hypothetical protein